MSSGGGGTSVTITQGTRTLIVSDGTNVTLSVNTVTSPGGADTSIQFNQSGVFGGSSNLAWNYGTNALTVNGNIGVGTSSPNAKIDLGSSTGLNGIYVFDDGTGASGLGISTNTLNMFSAGTTDPLVRGIHGFWRLHAIHVFGQRATSVLGHLHLVTH